MTTIEWLPFQTAFDPPQQAEGSLDPLGLYVIADALGVRLAPGVRERQSKPRYLTLALVGFTACQNSLQELGAQKRLPAWLVYEWLVVLALVKHFGGTSELQGIPGRDKVGETVRRGEAVCASNYLKTPSVFGFHGIYRVFGVRTGLFDADGNPLEAGRHLLLAWQQDQQLAGFVDGDGPGRELRRGIEKAVRSGIEAGRMAMPGNELSAAIAEHLNPHKPGRRERDQLWSVVTSTDMLRGEYAKLLSSPQGQADWQDVEYGEADYHTRLLDRASLPMRQLLSTIRAYEHLSRLLTDAFDEVRWNMSSAGGVIHVSDLARGVCLQRACADGPVVFDAALKHLGEVDPHLRVRAENTLSWVGEARNAPDFTAQLLAHHQRVQSAKPPNGKRPWFDALGDGRMAIRPAYVPEDFTPRDGVYVHAYRTRPIWSFASDLGQVATAGTKP